MAYYVQLYGGMLDRYGNLNAEAKSRCDTAIQEFRKASDAVMIFCVDDVIPGLRDVTLMHLHANGIYEPNMLIAPKKGHDTFGETKGGLEILRERGANQIVVVSNHYHMHRIKAMWRYLGFSGQIVPCPCPITRHPILSWVSERLRFMKFWGRILAQQI